jgi:hypothetical protein
LRGDPAARLLDGPNVAIAAQKGKLRALATESHE